MSKLAAETALNANLFPCRESRMRLENAKKFTQFCIARVIQNTTVDLLPRSWNVLVTRRGFRRKLSGMIGSLPLAYSTKQGHVLL